MITSNFSSHWNHQSSVTGPNINSKKSMIPLVRRNMLKKVIVAGGIGAGSYIAYKAYLNNNDPNKIFSRERFIPLTVSKITPVNHNTNIYRLKFPKPLKEPSPIASCVLVKDDSTQIVRPYTPISLIDELKFIDLLVKRYDNGQMSKLIHTLKVGDKIDTKGPIVTLPYTANMKKHIGMICGGTGITPMHQLIDYILRTPEDKTKIHLIYANISKEDILLYEELEKLSKNNPERLKIYYTLDNPPKDGWTQGVGYVSEEMVKENIPPPSDDVLVLVCGPGGMMRMVSGAKARDRSQGPVGGVLKELGYTKDQVFKF